MSNKTTIGTKCHVYDGPHATPTKTEQGPVYLGIDTITDDGHINQAEYSHLSDIDYKTWTKRVTPQYGDLVFSYEATLGRYALIPEGFHGCLGRRLAVVRPKDNQINIRWLYYYFLSPEWKVFIANHTVKGSTVNRISVDDFPQYPIPLLDRSEQDRIVCVLGTIDEKIALNKRINAELEALAKTIYDYWFVQFDFPDENGKPYRTSGGAMEYNDQLKRKIPKGWKATKLKDVVSISGQATIAGEHLKDMLYTPIDEIPKRSMSFFGGLPYGKANSSLQLYKRGDILLGAMRVYFHRVCIAAQNGITRSTTIILKPNDKTQLPFAFEVLNMDRTIQYATKISVGTQQPYVNWEGALDSYLIAMPSDDRLIDCYSEKVQPIIDTVMGKAQENYELTRLRDWLLPMLMNGQATVTDEQPTETRQNVVEMLNKDERFDLWLQNQGIAARGNLDRKTLREIFDAMDDDDK
ncbi:MAG: hypothetical protein E7476_08935 [Ruminococcaceae bacterium]|nr:hypothetical protein [Oscillospiraceae bacterium]